MSTVNVTNIKHPSSTTNNIVLNSDGTCSFGGGEGKIIQVKAYMTNHVARVTSTNYIWGSSNGSSPVGNRIQFTPVSTSNRLILQSSLAMGRSNVNGGVKWNINGSSLDSAWMAVTTNAQHGSGSYTGAFSTTDDGFGTSSDYNIGHESVTLITASSYTLPSSIDFGLYYYLGHTDGWVTFNRQNTDTNGRAVSSLVIYEVESA